MLSRLPFLRRGGEEVGRTNREIMLLGVTQKRLGISSRDNPASAAFGLRFHPSIHARYVFSGHCNYRANSAGLGNDCLRWVEVRLAHGGIFATIANIVKRKFAMFAIAVFADIAKSREHG